MMEFLSLLSLAVLPLMQESAPTPTPLTLQKRAYVGTRIGLELEGRFVGYLKGFSGGAVAADVTTARVGTDPILKKHLGPLRYEPLVLKGGMDLDPAFYTWLENYQTQSKSGALIITDDDYKIVKRLEFSRALIAELALPALDASSKDTAYLTIILEAEQIKNGAVSVGQKLPASAAQKAQKKWLPSNFRLTIGGLDCTKVSQIAPLIFRHKVVTQAIGEQRDPSKTQATFGLSDLSFSQAISHSKTLEQWHQSFLIEGNNAEQNEKSGTLEFLTPDVKSTLLTITLSGLGIYRIAPSTYEAKQEATTTTLSAQLYVEQAQLRFNTVAQAALPTTDEMTPTTEAPSNTAPAMPSKEARFGTPYLATQESPWAITLEKAEYSAQAFAFGEPTNSPKLWSLGAGEKYLKLTATLRNVSSAAQSFGYGNLPVLAVGSDGNNTANVLYWKRLDTGDEASAELPVGQSLRMETVVAVPGSGAARSVQVGANSYALGTESNPVLPLPKYLGGVDGLTLLPECPVRKGDLCPLGHFEAALVGVSRTNKAFEGAGELESDKTFFVVTLRVKNAALDESALAYGTLQLELTDSGDDIYKATQPYKEQENQPLTAPFGGLGKDTRERLIRYVFLIPATVQPRRLTIREGNSRLYVYPATDLTVGK
jgi:T4-like virus tail tube protein gp19